jgi:hypothetical protein
MMYVPLERAQSLLFQNGEADPRLAALEVDLYQRNGKNPAMYVGHLNSGHPEIEMFSSSQEGLNYVAKLKNMQTGDVTVDFVVVNGLENK